MDFIKIQHASKRFGGVHALKDVTFSVKKGEIHGLIGENGSGKSTLIKILAGVLPADEGEITIEGKKITSYGPLTGIRHGISVIYQDISLFPNLSVMENILLGRVLEQNKKVFRKKQYEARVEEILEDLGVDIKLDELVGELPIAQQQLVAIARALNNESKLLILDEPTTALTRQEINQLFKLVNNLKSKGISVIFISHKLDEIEELCETVTILRDGELIASKPMAELTIEKIENYMVGKSMIHAKDVVETEFEEVVMEVKELTKRNNFADISFKLHKGEILGIIGLLGSGRTELASALFGVAPADSGSIIMDGEATRINSVEDAVQYGIAYVPEDRLTQGLVMNKSINLNIGIATLDNSTSKVGLVDTKKLSDLSDYWIKEMAIKTDSKDKLAKMLSGGNQQKIVLSKWLAMGPKVLILDGPTVGIDIGAKAGIFVTINKMAKEKGMGVILISDEIREITSHCHRVIIMRNGRFSKELVGNEIEDAAIQRELDEQKRIIAQEIT
ncbi:MAG: sugar ABC transporter ATP-binding protein [Spirochaetia bacterium]|nr:sugar ABC transporter ATP-binding protein [Spirochaetia bacterium]